MNCPAASRQGGKPGKTKVFAPETPGECLYGQAHGLPHLPRPPPGAAGFFFRKYERGRPARGRRLPSSQRAGADLPGRLQAGLPGRKSRYQGKDVYAEKDGLPYPEAVFGDILHLDKYATGSG